MSKKSKLKQRLEAEALAHNRWNDVLSATRKFNVTKESKWNKRTLDSTITSKVRPDVLSKYIIRPLDAFKPLSYNKEKQVIELINHLYVKYRNAPRFLYDSIIPHGGTGPVEHDTYVPWFMTIVQGGSFIKTVKDIMTKREANLFLKGRNDRTVVQNVWIARMKAIDMPTWLIDRLTDKHGMFAMLSIKPDYMCAGVNQGQRAIDCMHMWKHISGDLTKENVQEMIDFVRHTLNNNTTFCFKGRSYSSMVRLSNEWHRVQVVLASNGSQGFVEWAGRGWPVWKEKITVKVGESTVPYLVEVTELTSSRGLLDEGSKQRHCVGSYINSCVNDRCNIFTMRFYTCHRNPAYREDSGLDKWLKQDHVERLTIEVAGSTVRQVKGKCNRLAHDYEIPVVRKWVGEKGLTVSNWVLR